MKKLAFVLILITISSNVFAATGNNENLDFLSSSAEKLLGTWKGDVIFNQEHRYWTLTKKRDHSVHYNFKVCDLDNNNCKQWQEEGGWDADENYFYSIFGVDESGKPEGHVYKYDILSDGCIEYIMVASSFKEHIEKSDKTYNMDDYVNSYRFKECRVN